MNELAHYIRVGLCSRKGSVPKLLGRIISQMHDSKIVEVVTCSKKRGTEKVPKRSNPKAHSLCTMLRTLETTTENFQI